MPRRFQIDPNGWRTPLPLTYPGQRWEQMLLSGHECRSIVSFEIGTRAGDCDVTVAYLANL